jgi:hypothetical protein
MNFWRLWPTTVRWGDLEKSVRMHVVVAVALYAVVAIAGFFRVGPTRKDLMMFEFARAHVEEGLQQTHGYNLGTKWNTSPTKVSWGHHHVYVSAPPLYPLFCGTTYLLSGCHWRGLLLAPILLGLLFLYSCLALGAKFLRGPARGWMMYLALTPMILIYATDLEINTGHLGLAILAYLCFVNYLETARTPWMLGAAGWYLAAFWSSFIAVSIVPGMAVQLLGHRGLSWAQRRRGLWLWGATVGVGFVLMVVHWTALPGAFDWMGDRIRTRTSAAVAPGTTNPITATTFMMRQGIRLLTYYTPIAVALAGGALWVAGRRLWRSRTTPAVPGRQPVCAEAALAQFFTWGLPSGVLAVNLAYVHPHYLYYFAIFFVFGSALGLQWLSGRVRSASWRAGLVGVVLGLFVVVSLARSAISISGRSLPGLVYDYLPAFVISRWNVRPLIHPGAVPADQW